MDPMTMMLIAQGVGKGVQAGSRLAQPSFQNSRYGRLLRQRKKEGNLTPGQEMNVLGRTATTATKQANLANKRYMGSMINKGLQGSVSAQRGLREAEADVRRTVTDTARGISSREEQAKSKAKLDYAKAMDKDRGERRQAGLGMLSAGVETFANLQGKKAQEQQATDKSFESAVNRYGREAMGLQTMDKDAGYYELPSGQVRYAGEGLTQDDKRAIEMYAQKANIQNSTTVGNTFGQYLSGDLDPEKFLDKMESLGLSQEQIIELMKQLSQ